MATPRDITLADIQQERLILREISGMIHWERAYVVLDDTGNPIGSLGKRTVSGVEEFDLLPQAIKDALQTIDQFTYNAALAQEGIE